MSEIKNTTHTLGPWSYIDEREGTPNAFRIASAKGTDAVAYVVDYRDPEGNDEETEANAARIVDCVNACAGIADPGAALAEVRAAMKDVLNHLTDNCDGRDPASNDYVAAGVLRAALALLAP